MPFTSSNARSSNAADSLLDERYLLAERIGVGGFSEVWRAHDLVLDRPVAVKLLHAGFEAHEETLQRFRAEARHAGALSHENIARVYDYGDPSPRHPPYLVMELIDGDSLSQVLRAGGAMDAARAMDITAQTAAGLRAAHQAGLIHRDIKPANLLLSTAGVVKITDFGISHAAGSAPMTRTGMIIGTPAYLAPERASGAQATSSSDLYSLGVVAYECLAGRAPFDGTAIEVALAHRERPFPPLPASVPAAVAGLVGDLSAKDPAGRPASAAEAAARARGLRDQLRANQQTPAPTLIAAQPVPASPVPASPVPASYPQAANPTEWLAEPALRRRHPGRRFAAGVVGGLAAAALIGIGGFSLLAPATAHHSTGPPPKASPVKATRVTVDSERFIGLPVRVAVRELQRQHLIVQVNREMTFAQRQGRVVAVEPSGQVPVGSVVIVIGAQRPGGGPDHHDHGKGHGGGGDNGNGDGNGGGGQGD